MKKDPKKTANRGRFSPFSMIARLFSSMFGSRHGFSGYTPLIKLNPRQVDPDVQAAKLERRRDRRAEKREIRKRRNRLIRRRGWAHGR